MVAFTLHDGQIGTITHGPDAQHPYRVQADDKPLQTDAVLSEVPDALRLRAGDTTMSVDVATALRARTGPVETYNVGQAAQALTNALDVRALVDVDDEDQEITFFLADDQVGTIDRSADDRYPYQVQVAHAFGHAKTQINAQVHEIPDAVRLLTGQGGIHSSTAEALSARSHPVPADEHEGQNPCPPRKSQQDLGSGAE